MFLHTSCSYSRYVTSSTPALASFRRPSKAAINAGGVSRCAIERNRVVLSALASSDNRLSSVDMVLDIGVSPCIPHSGRPDVSPFPPAGTVAAPRRALRFPIFAVTMGSYDCFAIRPRSPLVSLGGRYLREEEIGSSLGFLENPFGNMPRARDSGGPVRPHPTGRPGTAFRSHNSVGVRHVFDFGAESSRPASLLCTLRTHRSPGEWQHVLPACWLALAGRDSHPLDSTKRFHWLISAPPLPSFSQRDMRVNAECAHQVRPPPEAGRCARPRAPRRSPTSSDGRCASAEEPGGFAASGLEDSSPSPVDRANRRAAVSLQRTGRWGPPSAVPAARWRAPRRVQPPVLRRGLSLRRWRVPVG